MTETQFSFHNYGAIKRMKAALVFSTHLPNNLAQESVAAHTSVEEPGLSSAPATRGVSGLKTRNAKQECEI